MSCMCDLFGLSCNHEDRATISLEQFSVETSEINSHIDDVIIPNNVDHSNGLVGQIRQNERSAQLTFPHEEDVVWVAPRAI